MTKSQYNISDYLAWRGDIEINSKNINEVDILAFTQISYSNFDNAFKNQDKVSLEEAMKHIDDSNFEKGLFSRDEERHNFVLAMSKTDRFKKLILHDYVNIVDKKSNMQFSAISATIDDKLEIVAFRGTDQTLVGWKENLYLSFIIPVHAQEKAREYLNKVSKGSKKKIIVTGHSKGGNLAVYSSIYACKTTKRRIQSVYSFDGPGFEEEIVNGEEYKGMSDKIKLFIPKNTLVGALLNNNCYQKVVDSDAVGIAQHDALTWNLIGNKFVESQRSETSIKFDKELENWLVKHDKETRKILIGFLFDALESSGVESVNDKNLIIKSASGFIEGLGEMSKEQKSSLITIIKLILAYNAGSIKDQIKERIFGK